MSEQKTAAKEEKEVKKEMKEAKVAEILNAIQIALDDYTDIFSDFDLSPYNKRLFSEDFLNEMQRRYTQTPKGDIEVRFTLPAVKRDSKVEALIKRRLKQHFSSRIKDVDKEIGKLRKRGMIYIVAGFLLLALELFIYDIEALPVQLLSVLIVPAGWFGMYSGLEHLLDYPSELVDEKRFYERFNKAKYIFISEEELLKQMQSAEEAAGHIKKEKKTTK